MSKERTLTGEESLSAFFWQANASDSIPHGILRAIRPNESAEWNEAEDKRRNHRNVESYVRQADKAVELLATRQR